MTADSLKSGLENALSELEGVLDDLVTMHPERMDCSETLHKVSASLGPLTASRSFSGNTGQIEALLQSILASAQTIGRLLDSAAAFYYGRLSAACPPAAAYSPDGESSLTSYQSMLRMEA